MGGQGGCERRIEELKFLRKLKKKKIFFLGGGGGVGSGGGGGGGGGRVRGVRLVWGSGWM